MSTAAKVAIVSGASQGLGLAFAQRLAAEGYNVLAFDIKHEVTTLEGVTGMVADVSNRADVERVVSKAATMGEIEVLINNAGAWKRTPVTNSWEQAISDWDDLMDTNLKGALTLSRTAIPHLKRAGGGFIFNVSSYYVLPAKSDGTNPPETDLYSASKWALNGFTESWAASLAKANIKVNGLCMGAVDTPMLRGLFPGNELPSGLSEKLIQSSDIAQQMVDVMNSGRTGENFGSWVGEPVSIGPQKPIHRRITG